MSGKQRIFVNATPFCGRLFIAKSGRDGFQSLSMALGLLSPAPKPSAGLQDFVRVKQDYRPNSHVISKKIIAKKHF
jgi:hypothetical protein